MNIDGNSEDEDGVVVPDLVGMGREDSEQILWGVGLRERRMGGPVREDSRTPLPIPLVRGKSTLLKSGISSSGEELL